MHDGLAQRVVIVLRDLMSRFTQLHVYGSLRPFHSENGMAYNNNERLILVAYGKHIREARKALGWSQGRLAKAVGLDRTYVTGIECGKRNASLLVMHRLAEILGTQFSDFLPCRAADGLGNRQT